MDGFIDFYQILGISRKASKEEIKKAYRNLVKIHHPDKGGTNEEFILIKTAYDTLYSDHKREQYNRIYDYFFNYRQKNKNTYNNQSYNSERKSSTTHRKENGVKYNNQNGSTAKNDSSGSKKEYTNQKHPANNPNRWRLVAIFTSVISVILVIILISQPSFYNNEEAVGNSDTIEVFLASQNNEMNIEEAMHVHLEEAVDMERDFEEYQGAITDLEQQEQEIYGKIINFGKNQHDQRKKLADKALTLNLERTNLLQLEKESIDASREEFEKILPMIQTLGSVEVREKVEMMYDTMQERYEAYNRLNEIYIEAIGIENEMYENLKQKNVEEQKLDDQVYQLNILYERVLQSNDLFNKKTEEYNILKSEFYESSGLSIQ